MQVCIHAIYAYVVPKRYICCLHAYDVLLLLGSGHEMYKCVKGFNGFNQVCQED